MLGPTDRFATSRREFLKMTAAGSALLAAKSLGRRAMAQTAKSSTIELPELAYPPDALEPYISGRTIQFHYGQHHRAYVAKTQALVQGTAYANDSLQDIVRRTAGKPEKAAIFNNASQAWNHAFYWKCLKPKGGGAPDDMLRKRIERSFGSLDGFKQKFAEAAASQFGSGWAWLAADREGLKVFSTSNAGSPLEDGRRPLLVLDVWEHAYYLDYQNRRADYIQAFLEHLVNWEFVEKNLGQ